MLAYAAGSSGLSRGSCSSVFSDGRSLEQLTKDMKPEDEEQPEDAIFPDEEQLLLRFQQQLLDPFMPPEGEYQEGDDGSDDEPRHLLDKSLKLEDACNCSSEKLMQPIRSKVVQHANAAASA